MTDVHYSGTKAQAEALQVGTGNNYFTSATWHFNSSGQGGESSSHSFGDNLAWEVSSAGMLTISGTGSMKDLNEDAPWNEQISRITTITVGDGITSIGKNVFTGCDQTLIVNLPSTITNIGENAFKQCSAIKVVNYSGTTVLKNMLVIGSGNDYLTSVDWYCSDGESQGIGATSGTCGTKRDTNHFWNRNDE